MLELVNCGALQVRAAPSFGGISGIFHDSLASFCLLFALLALALLLLLRCNGRQRGVLEELTARCTASRLGDRSVAASISIPTRAKSRRW